MFYSWVFHFFENMKRWLSSSLSSTMIIKNHIIIILESIVHVHFKTECDEYIRIFKYFWSEYFFGYSFLSFFGYEYIQIFVRVNFLDTNLFGYLFVEKILIQIYSDIRSYQFSRRKQIQKMLLLIFSGYYTLLMDILLISMIKNAM